MAWGVGARTHSLFIRAFQNEWPPRRKRNETCQLASVLVLTRPFAESVLLAYKASSLINKLDTQSFEAVKPGRNGEANRNLLRVAAALLLGAGGGFFCGELRHADIAQDQSSRSQVAAAEVHASPQEVNNEQAAEIETDTGMEEAEGCHPVGTVPLSSRLEPLHPSSHGNRVMKLNLLECSAKDSVTAPKGSICLTRHSIADAAARAAPAVVNLTVTFGGRGMFFGQSSGSGSIISPDGTILTNYHVIGELVRGKSKGKLVVTMQDGRTFEGEVKSYDTLADIAVVKVHSKTPLPTVTLGSSRILRPGEWVVALGSPLHLQNTVTAGIISYVDRKSSELGVRGAARTDYIQTDAAINQGNSGGPLLNLDGEVIGINNMKALAADGVSFAIPIDTVVKVIEQLKKHGRVLRPWLGLKMLNLTGPIVEQLKEKDASFPNVSEGVLVPQVIAGSPGDRAGFRAADVIVQFGGHSVRSVTEIVDILGDKVGSSFDVVVVRSQGRQVTLQVVPEEASPNM